MLLGYSFRSSRRRGLFIVHPRRVLAFVLAMALVISFQPAIASTGGGPNWHITDPQALNIDGTPLALSPDGAWIAGTGPDDDFCVWDVESLEPACDGRRLSPIIPHSVVWSPDSTAVAFSLDAPGSFVDSDVYIFETDVGTLVNLTEDDPEGTGADTIGRDWDAPEVPIDLFSSWSPDSQQVVFARTVWGSSDLATEWGNIDPATTLMTIDRFGGEPEELHSIEPPEPMIVNGPMSWQENDSILFGITKSNVDDDQNGIWKVSPEGTPTQILSGHQNADVPLPMIVDMTLDGSMASVVSLANAEVTSSPGGTYFMLDVDQNEVIPFEEMLGLPSDPVQDKNGGFLIAAPVFSPDDDAIAFVARTHDGRVSISVFSMGSGTTTEIYTFDETRTGQEDSGSEPFISWGSDSLLAMTHDGTILLTVEEE